MKTIISAIAAFLCTSVLVLGANHLAAADGDPATPTATPSAYETPAVDPAPTQVATGTPEPSQDVTEPSEPADDSDLSDDTDDSEETDTPLTTDMIQAVLIGKSRGVVQLAAPSVHVDRPERWESAAFEEDSGTYAVVLLSDGSVWGGLVKKDHLTVNGIAYPVW